MAISTPALVVDEQILADNIAAMAEFAAAHDVTLRPHVKTHKSIEIARRQLDAGATGITVATVSEAAVFAEAGFIDIFIAYPLWVDDARADALRVIGASTALRVGVDSWTAAEQLASAKLADVRVLVEVDSGHHRSGVAPDAAGQLASRCEDLGLNVAGVFTFPGHSYSPDHRATAALEEAAALTTAVKSLAAEGVIAQVVSGGSSPSAQFSQCDVLTELRPGVYVYGDAQQWELGACAAEDIALSVLATVVARHDDRIIADAGSKSLGAERASYSTGFGRLLDHPGARIVSLSEHHATITGVNLGVGSQLRIVPNHVCSAVNLADEFVMGEVRWPVDARGRNA